MRRAVVAGLLEQDGSYLAELLTDEGVQVHGIVRLRLSGRSTAIKDRLAARGCRPALHAVDLGDGDAVGRLLRDLTPDEIYHLTAEHHSAEEPVSSGTSDDPFAGNTERTRILLEAALSLPRPPAGVVASSSKFFDASPSSPQTETTPIVTGTARPVRAWVEQAAELLGIDGWERHLRVDPDLVAGAGTTFRSVPTRAEQELGWEQSVSFAGLVDHMVDEELPSPWPG